MQVGSDTVLPDCWLPPGKSKSRIILGKFPLHEVDQEFADNFTVVVRQQQRDRSRRCGRSDSRQHIVAAHPLHPCIRIDQIVVTLTSRIQDFRLGNPMGVCREGNLGLAGSSFDSPNQSSCRRDGVVGAVLGIDGQDVGYGPLDPRIQHIEYVVGPTPNDEERDNTVRFDNRHQPMLALKEIAIVVNHNRLGSQLPVPRPHVLGIA